jgi:rhamnosyltransferase
MSHQQPDRPSISIIIKTKNQRPFIERSLASIFSQTLHDFETIVVDSGSTDGALDVVRRYQSQYGASRLRLLQIPPAEFHHVKTLNFAVERARGQYIVSLSGDAVPATDTWLESLVRHFDDPLVAGVYGRQLSDSEAHLLERLRVVQRYGDECIIKTKGQDHIFSNANSMFRKSLAEAYRPDESLPACEDYDWAREMHERGYKIVYEPGAAVHHAHRVSPPAYLWRVLWFRYLRFKIDHLRRWPWLWRTLP